MDPAKAPLHAEERGRVTTTTLYATENCTARLFTAWRNPPAKLSHQDIGLDWCWSPKSSNLVFVHCASSCSSFTSLVYSQHHDSALPLVSARPLIRAQPSVTKRHSDLTSQHHHKANDHGDTQSTAIKTAESEVLSRRAKGHVGCLSLLLNTE